MKNDAQFSRRRLLGTSSLALATIGALGSAVGTQKASAAPQSGKTFEPLADFKFSLEATKGWVGEGGTAKEVTVAEFPVSKSIAGVSMRLKPGGLRELHWHAIAAEWAYMVEGNCRVTVYGPHGQVEVADFGPGDIWYFPKGHGHSLQGLGPGECHFILAFDNGEFSEFGTFSVTDWTSLVPRDILAQNLAISPGKLPTLPKSEVYIVPGKVPPAIQPSLRNKLFEPGPLGHKYSLAKQKPIVFPGGEERIVSSKEFPIQTTLTSVLLKLEPGALRELHWHPNADEWHYYLQGEAEVQVFGAHRRSKKETFSKGDVAFIEQGFGHYVRNIGSQELHVLVLFNSPVYEEIALNGWFGANPSQLLAENFQTSTNQVDAWPDSELGMLPELKGSTK
jgi:oxalate decarboxylase